MSASVALLRGVGGPTALRMADLRQALEDAGLTKARTLQVAGNIVFDQGDHPAPACAELIRDTVRQRFGHELPVLIRSHDQLVDAHHRNPFTGTQENRWVMTVFLETAPAPGIHLDPDTSAPDVFAVNGREVFIRYANGVAGSKLQSAWFEKHLGVTGTARNANTITKLIQLTT